jgi:hypothetical protein
MVPTVVPDHYGVGMRGGNDDDWDDVEHPLLDEEFIQSAARIEPSAEERIARAARIARDHEHATGWRQMPYFAEYTGPSYDPPPRRRRRGRALTSLLLVIALSFTAIHFEEPIRSLLGRNASSSPTATADRVDHIWHNVPPQGLQLPPLPPDAAAAPLGTPPPPPTGVGGYTFMRLQDGRPVAFDPCRPIHFVVRPTNEIPGGRGLLMQALAEVSRATGLVFRDDGPTDEAPSDQREPIQKERYGDRWAPVLIVWSDPNEAPRLAGQVAGYAGPQWISTTGKRNSNRNVTGTVVLDAPDLAKILKRKDGRAQVLAIIMHELGHLVGLDHVDDPKQLMNAENVGVKRFADGDLRGLHQLGLGACFREG